jgi:hypothetical protein
MNGVELRLLYRGALSSCNYDCGYCPFAKRVDSKELTARDRASLERFVDWCATTNYTLRILFTPWGEALVRRHYREAFVRLSHLQQVVELGIQTNLSRNPLWLETVNKAPIRLWCTYHPSQTTRQAFLRRIESLLRLGVGFSVGMVALREDLHEIAAMRLALDALAARGGHPIYLWLNAYDGRTEDYYQRADIETLSSIDPHFSYNLQPAPSLGAECSAGRRALSVDANGDVRPCHFVQLRLGNLYDGSFERGLAERPCPNARCDCYIGYALRDDLPFKAALTRHHAPMPC